MYLKNYKILIKEIKEGPNRMKNCHTVWTGRHVFVKIFVLLYLNDISDKHQL